MFVTDAGDLDALAAELQRDGVVVERVMGAGEAQESHDRLVELVKNVPFPVYVALVNVPEGSVGERGGDANEALAALLHRRIGGEGLYVVASDLGPQRVVSYGLGASPALLSLSNSANQRLVSDAAEDRAGKSVWVPNVVKAEATVRGAEDLVELAMRADSARDYPPTLDDDEVQDLADRAVALAARSNWHGNTSFAPVSGVSTGWSTLVGVLVGSAVALFLGQTLRGWPRRQRATNKVTARASRTHPALERVREEERVTSLLDLLVRRLERAAKDTSLDQDLYQRAHTARAAAERYVDSDELVDLVGVRVLVRTGQRDLARARGGKRGAYRACFFDPRHSEASTEEGWRLGEGLVRVACCRRCAKDLAAGREPQTLLARRRGRDVPYYLGDDVWARTGFGTLTDTFARDVLRDGDGTGDRG